MQESERGVKREVDREIEREKMRKMVKTSPFCTSGGLTDGERD